MDPFDSACGTDMRVVGGPAGKLHRNRSAICALKKLDDQVLFGHSRECGSLEAFLKGALKRSIDFENEMAYLQIY